MIYKTKYRQGVQLDLEDAKSYYRTISPNLAKRFLKEFRIHKNFISEFPYSNDVMYGENVRLQLLESFPYHIHYIINENKKQIVVLAVIFAKKENLNFSKRI